MKLKKVDWHVKNHIKKIMVITDFKKFFDVLQKSNVRYLIVGGVAAIGHGMAQTTTDVDICYERSKENIQSLVNSLRPGNPKLRVPGGNLSFLFDEKTIKNGLNFTLETDWGFIDLLGELSGVGQYSDLLPRAVDVVFYGHTIKTISLNDLIHAKQIAGRTKDKLHLLELEALRDIFQNNQKK